MMFPGSSMEFLEASELKGGKVITKDLTMFFFSRHFITLFMLSEFPACENVSAALDKSVAEPLFFLFFSPKAFKLLPAC